MGHVGRKTVRSPSGQQTMGRRETRALAKLWHLVTLLDTSDSGPTAARLTGHLCVSRRTLSRYLGSLEDAGVAIEKTSVGGKLRYRLARTALPAVIPSARQLAALRSTTDVLRTRASAELVHQLDMLLPGSAPTTCPVDVAASTIHIVGDGPVPARDGAGGALAAVSTHSPSRGHRNTRRFDGLEGLGMFRWSRRAARRRRA